MNLQKTLLSLFIVFSLVISSRAKEHITIAPVIGEGISKEKSNSLTNFFIRKYNKISENKVLAYDQLSAKVKESGFAWNTSFSDVANAFALARLLAVNYVILTDFQKTECRITIFDLMQNTTIENISKPFKGKVKDFITANIPEIVKKMDPILVTYIESLPEDLPPVKEEKDRDVKQEDFTSDLPEESIARDQSFETEEVSKEKIKSETKENKLKKPRERRDKREKKIAKTEDKQDKREKDIASKGEKRDRATPLFVKKIREKRKQDSLNLIQEKEGSEDFAQPTETPNQETLEEEQEESKREEKSGYLLGRLETRLEERKKEKRAAKLEQKKIKMIEIEKKRKQEEAVMDAKIDKLRKKAEKELAEKKAEEAKTE